MNIISFEEAQKNQYRFYFTGKPCKNGHIEQRRVSNKRCVECERIRGKKYRELNKQKVNNNCKKWFQKNKQKAYDLNNKWKLKNYERYLLIQAKSSAKKKNLEFSISEADIFIPQNCPALDIPLIKCPRETGQKHSDNCPTIDRIDSKKGYIPGNVVIVCNKANRIKNDSTPEELVAIAEYYRKFIV